MPENGSKRESNEDTIREDAFDGQPLQESRCRFNGTNYAGDRPWKQIYF